MPLIKYITLIQINRMKKNLLLYTACLGLLLSSCNNSNAQAGNVEQFKKAFYKRMMELLPAGFEKRIVKFVSVTQGSTTSGIQNFKVTAYIHDYDEGYAPNSYWGQTCVSKVDALPYTMQKDAYGDWLVQGRFTMTGANEKCENNTAQGVASLSIESVPGTIYNPSATTTARTETKTPAVKAANGQLYVGEYACYGYGNRIMAGMGFTLLNGGRYYDLDKQRGGSYVYNAAAGTIDFRGGFLSGQQGKNVTLRGFDLSATVFAEPWK